MLSIAVSEFRATMNAVLQKVREGEIVSITLRGTEIARLFGNTPEFWLNAQRAVDLWDAAQAAHTKLERIQPLRAA